MNEQLTRTTGNEGSMDSIEYDRRRTELKRKHTANRTIVILGGLFAPLVVPLLFAYLAYENMKSANAQLEQLDRKYEGEEYDERILADGLENETPMPRLNYWFYQIFVFLVAGWWTFGLANVWYHRYRKRVSNDRVERNTPDYAR